MSAWFLSSPTDFERISTFNTIKIVVTNANFQFCAKCGKGQKKQEMAPERPGAENAQ